MELFDTIQSLYKEREAALAKYKKTAREISASYPLVLTPHIYSYYAPRPMALVDGSSLISD